MNEFINKIKNSRHNNIFLYRIAQIVLISTLEIFLFSQGYPLWHIALITCITILLLIITKVREMAVGMFMAATNGRIQAMINTPRAIREDLMKKKIIETLATMDDELKN